MAVSVILGKNCKLYYNAGTYGSPTWTLVTGIKDVTLTGTLGEADVSSRDQAVKMSEPTLEEVELSFEQVRDSASTIQTALLAAKVARTAIDFFIAEGLYNTAGVRYFRGDFKCFESPVQQPLEGAATIPWKWKPCYSENVAAFATVSA